MLTAHFMWKCGASIQLPAGISKKNKEGESSGLLVVGGGGGGVP